MIKKKYASQNMTAPFFTLFPNRVEHIRTGNLENSAQQQVQYDSNEQPAAVQLVTIQCDVPNGIEILAVLRLCIFI